MDTGSEVSVIPPTCIEHSNPDTTFSLPAVDGSRIATYGVRSCTLNIGLRHSFRWVFIVTNVTRAIIGADFLHHLGLNVDIRHRTLTDSTTLIYVCGLSFDTPTGSRGLAHLWQDSNNLYLTLLFEFPAVTQACALDRSVKHSFSHHIETTGQPVFTRSRHLALECLHITQQEFDHMLKGAGT